VGHFFHVLSVLHVYSVEHDSIDGQIVLRLEYAN